MRGLLKHSLVEVEVPCKPNSQTEVLRPYFMAALRLEPPGTKDLNVDDISKKSAVVGTMYKEKAEERTQKKSIRSMTSNSPLPQPKSSHDNNYKELPKFFCSFFLLVY